MPPVLLVLGALALAYGGIRLVRRAAGVDVSNPPPLSATCPTGKDQCPPSEFGPAPPGFAPAAGVASSLGYRWCHVVEKGDTAGNIAERVVGDAARYLELLAGNPHKRTVLVTDPKSGRSEINFVPGTLCVGERLNLPPSWNPWMDQLGSARGGVKPFAPFDLLPPYPTMPTGAAGGAAVRALGYLPGPGYTWVKIPS